VFCVRTLEEIFPYEEFRPYQRNLIEYMYNSFTSDKIAVVYAPTGLGKTVSILTAYLLEPRDKLLILTRTRNQSSIYARELSRIKSKIGRVDYVFIRSKQELCAIASKSEKIRSLPYTVFIRICEKLKRDGKCPYYKRSIVDGEFTDILTKSAYMVLSRGAILSRIIRVGIRNRICPYELARFLARKANIVVGTYSYVFNPKIREAFLSGLDSTLEDIVLVVDEAHNLPSFIENQHVKSMNLGSIELAVRKIKRLPRNEILENISGILEDFLDQVRTSIGAENKKILEMDISEAIGSIDLNELDSIVDISQELMETDPDLAYSLLKFVDFVDYYVNNYRIDLYVCTGEQSYSRRLGYHYTIKLNLLDPSSQAVEVFKKVKAAILMSGSLHPLEYYKITLGLSEPGIYERTTTAVFPSPFPRESMRVYVDVALTSRYEERTPDMYSLYARRIELIVEGLPRDKAILVVFPSYSIQKEVSSRMNISNRGYIIEHRKTRINEVKFFLSDNPGAVILSVSGGKLAEGIDYRIGGKTILQAVIVAGLPFPEYSIVLRKKQEYFEKRFGDRFVAIFLTTIAPMVRAIIQAAGRLIRCKDDKGVVFILDRRFSKYSNYFPRVPWQTYEPYRHEYMLRRILNEAINFLQS